MGPKNDDQSIDHESNGTDQPPAVSQSIVLSSEIVLVYVLRESGARGHLTSGRVERARGVVWMYLTFTEAISSTFLENVSEAGVFSIRMIKRLKDGAKSVRRISRGSIHRRLSRSDLAKERDPHRAYIHTI